MALLAMLTSADRMGGELDVNGCMASAGYSWCDSLSQCIRSWETTCPSAAMLGGDVDDNGCTTAAGYSWCESLSQCIRSWETDCPEDTELHLLDFKYWDPTHRLSQCEGDCDTDSDCRDDLVCWQQDDYDVPPGCHGDVEYQGADYCVVDASTSEPTQHPTYDLVLESETAEQCQSNYNLGTFSNAAACASVGFTSDECDTTDGSVKIMWDDYYSVDEASWGCRCCRTDAVYSDHDIWSLMSYKFAPVLIIDPTDAMIGGLTACPDVLREESPLTLYVKFESLLQSLFVNEETPVIPKQTASSEPKVRWNTDTLQDGHYTVLMVDPDAPSHDNPVMAEWLHWMVVNVPDSGMHVDGGDIVMEYAGPNPPVDTGDHRYCLYVFKQRKEDSRLAELRFDGRAGFDTKQFLETSGDGLQLIASNVFKSNFEAGLQEEL